MYIRTLVATLLLMATSAGALGQSCGTCDWYGNEYPVCCNQSTEWGWENNQSCIGATTCTDAGQAYSDAQNSDSCNGNSLSLSNPSASPEAVALFRFINDMYGQKTLTGQQESTWMADGPQHELSYILQHTGKQPAVLGLDYIDPDDYDGVNDRATAWYHDRGGIPSIMWHWGAPDIGTGYENSKMDFNLPAALTDGTPENRAMMRDMDIIASHLAVLRDRNVPVLWRPLHEFTGTWFWWGQHGPDNFKQLWIKMYDYFTYEKGLSNLIWVLPYSGEPDANYYPGDQYVDIGAADTYVDHNGSLVNLYDQVRNIVGDIRAIALHENGSIPDPQAMLDDGAKWSWFNTWHTSWLTDSNQKSWLNYVYNHDHYVTLDELPELHNYGQ